MLFFLLKQLIYGDQGEVKTEKVNSPEIKEPEQDQDDKTKFQETKDVSCDVHDQVIMSFIMVSVSNL